MMKLYEHGANNRQPHQLLNEPMTSLPPGHLSTDLDEVDLLAEMTEAHRDTDASDASRRAFIARYGFAVASPEALERLRARSPVGVVDVGAGTGAWARLIAERGTPVTAIDPEPAPSAANRWFAGSSSWFTIERSDHSAVAEHADRTMLISWPTRNEVWPYEALSLFHAAGGSCVAYIGEPPGGRTGDDVFHRLLGELTRCRQCRDGNADAPCVCGISALWRVDEVVDLAQLPGHEDQLRFYRRTTRRRGARRRRSLRQRQ